MSENKNNGLSRRDFLKVIGIAGGTAAVTGACSGDPVEQIIPYVIPPESYVPAVPKFYASTCRECPAGCGIVVKNRDGRAIKVEGNPSNPFNNGSTCARGQASLQGLYNPDRIRSPLGRKENRKSLAPIGWDEGIDTLSGKINELVSSGRGNRIIYLSNNVSGTLDSLINKWIGSIGGRRYTYESFSYDPIKEANKVCFGIDEIPTYRIEKAKYVLSFGADFLETWLSPTYFARGFSEIRTYKNGKMGKVVQVEPRASVTAASADLWVAVKPGTEVFLALGIANVMVRNKLNKRSHSAVRNLISGYTAEKVSKLTDIPVETINQIAYDFSKNKSIAIGGGVATSGTNATETMVAVNVLNYLAGNIGSTVDFSNTLSLSSVSSFKDITKLFQDMKAGKVELLIVHGTNPAFTLPKSLKAAEALNEVDYIVSLSSFMDETTEMASLVLPDHHSLESWGDYNSSRSYIGIIQPVMHPIFNTKSTGDLILEVSKKIDSTKDLFEEPSYYEYLRNSWKKFAPTKSPPSKGFEVFWKESLKNGGVQLGISPREVSINVLQKAGNRQDSIIGDSVIDKVLDDLGKVGKVIAILMEKVKDLVSIEKAVEAIFGVGVPALILLIAISLSGYTGAAAITSTLAAIGIGGGMVGGILVLAGLALIFAALGKYGFNEIFPRVVQKFKEEGITKEEILSKIENYPVFKETKLKQKVKGWVNENWEKTSYSPTLNSLQFSEPNIKGDGEFYFVTYPSYRYYDGSGANKPWLQELPEALSTSVWDSYVEVHPDTAKKLGIREGSYLNIRSPQGEFKVQAFVYEGIRPDTVAVPMGQGHTSYGRYAKNRGVNPLDLLPDVRDARSGGLAFLSTKVSVSNAGSHSLLVRTQYTKTQHDRDVAKAVTLGELKKGAHDKHHEEYDFYPPREYAKHRWAMNIDLSKCTGCGACVTACYAENNIPFVGKDQVAKRRDMAWIRIERYFDKDKSGKMDVRFLPMLCQHCGNAPCEPVCPVYATYHSPEGLNGMVYNRCVGTRYCANNCTYKVRRFNWYTYKFPEPLNWQLNPDVTVRTKGVMEKCTFCVQRIKFGQDIAKDGDGVVRDGDIVTACQQACPTNAIVFGDLKDKSSKVAKLEKDKRGYKVLEVINTKPGITYLKKLKWDKA